MCNGFVYSSTTAECRLVFLLYTDCATFGGMTLDSGDDSAYYDRDDGEQEYVGPGSIM